MSDPRFARIKTDPRFRRPKKKQNKVVVDERFKSVFEREKKEKSRRVDKYGRTVSETHERDNLRRFYRLEGQDDDEDDDISAKRDLARGGVLLESSDEEEQKQDDSDGDESDTTGIVTLGTHVPEGEVEVDLNEDDFEALDAQAAAFAKENPEKAPSKSPCSCRLAIVNLDWDHVRAGDLYRICSSLVSPTPTSSSSIPSKHTSNPNRSMMEALQVNVVRGKVLSVAVYPSDFGRERMAREEKEGPPPEIFRKRNVDEEVDEKNIYEVGGEDEVDEDALRRYQLERLRYYYAIISCDTMEAASHIYAELEGTELERSANVFDMSFVPDDMTFENEPRDEATEDLGTHGKGVDFVTDALRHSKVKLTWDEDDAQRNRVTRRVLTRKEIEDDDFRAYIANTSSDSETEGDAQRRKKNKKVARDRLRALLLDGNEEGIPEGWGDEKAEDVDMEITFTPGLTENKGEGDETSLEVYQRKMKDKRKKKKEELKEKVVKNGKGNDNGSGMGDDFFEVGQGERPTETHKKDKGKKKQIQETEDSVRQEATEEELALLIASDNPGAQPEHFNLTSILKAEKGRRIKGRKLKKRKHDDEDNDVQEGFVMDVKDVRFKVLHQDHQFAIDPSNPHFKKTKAMEALLEERRKQAQRRASPDVRNGFESGTGSKSLQKLVDSVKRKSANVGSRGEGKRRKLYKT